MKLRLPRLSHGHDYVSEMHLYIDDIKELTELRDNAPTTDEQLFYSKLITGAQKVLEWMQEETTHGR